MNIDFTATELVILCTALACYQNELLSSDIEMHNAIEVIRNKMNMFN